MGRKEGGAMVNQMFLAEEIKIAISTSLTY